TVDARAIKSQNIEYLNDTKKILGYQCKKAKSIVNSNTIEFWYTTELPIQAAPTILGQGLGAVLEMVRNGNLTYTATEIKKEKIVLPDYFTTSKPEAMSILDYKDAIWQTKFTTIPLFKNQRINFFETDTVNTDFMRFANGTIVLKKVQLPSWEKGKSVFLDLIERSAGDAYDRTGTVFLIPTDKKQSFLDGLKSGPKILPIYENGNGKKYQGVVATETYNPAIELMRFFTPFGVKQYNHIQLKGKEWQNAVPYRQDISDFSHLLNGKEVYIGVFIGNYDKGGHIVDANITLHNGGRNPFNKIVPLFNTLNIMEMAGQEYATMFDNEKGLILDFELKDSIKNAVLRYTTTGHGGWGNGDEFVPKENTILLNGNIVFKMTPWREDCGSYRLYNPASGNFSNGLSSSDLSRSNWCPGTITNPFFIALGNLAPGKYTIQVKIPQGKPEGNSFSSWNVSGVIVGE
ncbi:MAG: peptide-N-glycosidase, partial [Chitinophagaceae bacterium]